ncbi:MAG: hypothetical protein ACYDAJ_02325 [Nitrosotalea sp.]
MSMLIDYSSKIERLESLVDEKNQKIREFENKPLDIEKAFEHVLDCNRCQNTMIDKRSCGYLKKNSKNTTLCPSEIRFN